MSSKRINVRIFPDGRIQAETQGIVGKKCTDYISVLEDLLDAETVESSYTPEFYVTEETSVKQIQDQTLRDQN